ncbi:type III restriction endonuclease [Deltaproteobacteria bacterium]|nr:type III restriction endonuclease [Deltaproteobacteria bacterium]
MELNNYQRQAISDLSSYLGLLDSANYADAYRDHWLAKDVKVGPASNCFPPYQDTIKGAPHVCFKVPTGGGKTFLACAAVKIILDALTIRSLRTVVWLVPSNTILEQTERALSNPNHPYRQRLDRDFGWRVAVYTKSQLLQGQNFSPTSVREQLSLCVLSFDSLRSAKKDGRKVYQENSQLAPFTKTFSSPETLLDDIDDTALIQVLNQLSPVVIVDESHNAQSELSVEMLRNLNPSFVLDLTATPRANSNIISYVDARELKKENMVKLPVVVYNRYSKKEVIVDAIRLRGMIEEQAKTAQASTGKYIRPIVLFQAQPKGREDASTFQKLKDELIDCGITADEIAIKTAEINEIKNIDLQSPDGEIRYIITVNALKEGWDCPFAYILATLANKTSKVDVEQIVGRVLRQPGAQRYDQLILNSCYVLTCSNDFFNTLESIVAGLNKAGFSKKDMRIGESEVTEQAPVTAPAPTQTSLLDWKPQAGEEFLDDVDSAAIRKTLEQQGSNPEIAGAAIAAMAREAIEQSMAYETENAAGAAAGIVGSALGEKMNRFVMREEYRAEAESLILPQFFIETKADLFHKEDFTLLTKESLSAGCSLQNKDAGINFDLSGNDVYSVDLVESGDAVPRYKKMTKEESRYVKALIAGKAPEEQRRMWVDVLAGLLDKKSNALDALSTLDLKAYVQRIVDGMDRDTLASLENAAPAFARKIRERIESLLTEYRQNHFKQGLDTGKYLCRPSYKLPKVITPVEAGSSLDKSLYESEGSLNGFEREVISHVAAMKNVRWWHRIIERKDYSFFINGFINHYPDFLALTHSGKLIVIEAKGDDRDNSDSSLKLNLGRAWAAKSGTQYNYFMVFQTKDFHQDGAYALDEFLGVMEKN